MASRTVACFLRACLFAGLLSMRASAQKPELVVQTGQSTGIVAIAFSPDGKVLASGGGVVKLWDVATRREIRTLAGHVADVQSLAFSPDGKTLGAGTLGDGVVLWDVATGNRSGGFHTNEWVLSLAFSPDGNTLASQGGTALELWDVVSGTKTGTLPTKVHSWPRLAFTGDGRTLVSAEDLGIKLWDVATRTEIRTLTGHSSPVTSIALSPDGKTLASGSEDKTIKLWNIETGTEIRTLTGHTDKVWSVAFRRDGKTLASGSDDRTIREWNVLTGKEIRTLSGHTDEVSSVAFAADGKTLASGSLDSTVRLWDADTGKVLRTMGGRSENIESIAFSANGKLLASGTNNKTIGLWDLAAGKEIRTLTGHSDEILSVAFSADSTRLASAGADKTVILWDVAMGQEVRRLTGDIAFSSVAFSPDGRVVAGGSRDSVVKLWDVNTGKEIRTLKGTGAGLNPVAFSPDGKTLASVTSGEGLNRAVRLWDVATGNEIRTLLPGQIGDVTSVAFSPDGTAVGARGYVEGTIKAWSVATGELVLTAPAAKLSVQAMAFSPDGKFLAGGAYGGAIRIWDTQTGKVAQTTTGVPGTVCVAFSPDGNTLASGGSGPEIHLWDVRNQRDLGGFYAFPDGTWAVVDPEGRYDASNAGHIDGLHWVVNNEPIDLDELKERYYEPGLLAKLFGLDKEPLRDVSPFTTVDLYPDVTLTAPQENRCNVAIHLTNRGGGIGRVMAAVNGKEVAADARGSSPNPQAQQVDLELDLSKHPYLKVGEENTIEVRAYNAAGYLSSRNVTMACRVYGQTPLVHPSLWAIVAGISDYAGPDLRLRYAGKDAADMAQALRIGAERLFGANRTHINLLTTASVPGAVLPTRENLQKAFEWARQARSTDILVVYLAGHGVAYGGAEGDYYYLAQEARTGDLTDPAVRAQTAISSLEVTDWIKQIPALKQILVLDTCGAARLVQKLTERRDVPSSQLRSLERMKDRTGLFILAGSAADAVSYEASRYGQGLLTYSLLLGMRGAALREDGFVDVSKWFDFATDEVPELAQDVGGIQRPIIATPNGGASFDVGQILTADKSLIPLVSVRPLFLQSSFQDEVQLRDHLKLTTMVNDALRDVSSRGAEATLVYVDAADFPGAYSMAGRYRVEGSAVTTRVSVFKGEKEVGTFTVAGSTTELDKLTAAIVARAGHLAEGLQ